MNGIPHKNEQHVDSQLHEDELISRMALSDTYLALPYGYWNFTTSNIILAMQAKKRNMIGKAGSFLVRSLIMSLQNEKIFQKTDVVLRGRQYQDEELRIAYSVPMVRLAFSRDSCYLAGIDSGLDIVLWQLSIKHKPFRLTAARVWRRPLELVKNISFALIDDNGTVIDTVIDIAVQQQGVVAVYHSQTVSLLYRHKKKPISVVYSIGISFFGLTFMDDTTLVCETQNNGIVVFQLLKMDEDYRLSLIYSNEKFPLQLQGCNVAGTLGVTLPQRCLFEYHEAIGQPANLVAKTMPRWQQPLLKVSGFVKSTLLKS